MLKEIWHYLANLEWTERVQLICKFCHRGNFTNIVYEDDDVIAIDNVRLAGQHHWLIMPKRHVARDIESLNGGHAALLEEMDRVKDYLLEQNCPDLPRSAVHSGYHRGRRKLVGNIFYPDIVSIHHLHLHVIVRPRLAMRLFKYPPWLPLMWKSDTRVLREIRRQM
ncbi:hypothetical protein BB8028_0003g01440 [Beauveria bassiana]|uniref:HIT domain-containing protein n=1 Tax=Beauveria bassiana TaxID=176275 RepID=A0A2S7Y643_BEABA|nr:hypothetical protein BB8028_0003g01440 [Beauveria bassiana]